MYFISPQIIADGSCNVRYMCTCMQQSNIFFIHQKADIKYFSQLKTHDVIWCLWRRRVRFMMTTFSVCVSPRGGVVLLFTVTYPIFTMFDFCSYTTGQRIRSREAEIFFDSKHGFLPREIEKRGSWKFSSFPYFPFCHSKISAVTKFKVSQRCRI